MPIKKIRKTVRRPSTNNGKNLPRAIFGEMKKKQLKLQKNRKPVENQGKKS